MDEHALKNPQHGQILTQNWPTNGPKFEFLKKNKKFPSCYEKLRLKDNTQQETYCLCLNNENNKKYVQNTNITKAQQNS